MGLTVDTAGTDDTGAKDDRLAASLTLEAAAEQADQTVGITGRPWILRDYCQHEASALASRHNLPPALAAALVGRGIGDAQVAEFLKPRLKTSMPDPSRLRDMDRAVDLLLEAIQRGDRIGIFGDFDVDGASSSALLHRYLKAIGCDHEVYIPDRLSEGYGPNEPAMRGLVANGARLIITVDCGIAAHEPIAATNAAGAQVVVLDHHRPGESLPPAAAVVNPNRRDDDTGVGYLAGVGVAYLFLIALNRRLRAAGFFAERTEPPLLSWLDLVALGTVCDVVPLEGLNRALVAQGLRLLAEPQAVGLQVLRELTKLEGEVSTGDLGFQFGPRLNAAGRMGQSRLAFELLSASDETEARSIASTLDILNRQRQSIEQEVTRAAAEQAGQQPADAPVLFVHGAGWHGGVLGIAAGRLRERFGRPCLVATLEQDMLKGSGRSVPGVNLGAAIQAAVTAGIASSGGGHAMAAGFAVSLERAEAFHAFMIAHIHDALAGEPVLDPLLIDSWVAPTAVVPALAERLADLEPFGSGNPEPVFGLRAMQLTDASVVGRGHVRARFVSGGAWVQAIAFRVAEEPIGQALLQGMGERFDLAGTVRRNEWNGRVKADFVLSDIARC